MNPVQILDPSVCARCAAVNPTCCRMDASRTGECFPLSGPERERLAPYAAAKGVPASAEETNTRAFIKTMRALFPDRISLVDACFPENGTHGRLALHADGSCVFLEPDGCALPRQARPWYCQLFPIWIRKEYFDYFAAQSCLISHEAVTMKDVFALTGLEPADARDIYLSLCRDWGLLPDTDTD